MTKEIVLITGGARSGKSRCAEQRAAEMGARPVYVATAEAKDEEMAQRIAAHRKRRGDQWRTIEEPLELAEALLAQRGTTDCVLVDCLTLWISNLLIRHDDKYASEKVEEADRAAAPVEFSSGFRHQRGRLGHSSGQPAGAPVSRPCRLDQSTHGASSE